MVESGYAHGLAELSSTFSHAVAIHMLPELACFRNGLRENGYQQNHIFHDTVLFKLLSNIHIAFCLKKAYNLLEMLQIATKYVTAHYFQEPMLAKQALQQLKAMVQGRLRFTATHPHAGLKQNIKTYGYLEMYRISATPEQNKHWWEDPDTMLDQHLTCASLRALVWSYVLDATAHFTCLLTTPMTRLNAEVCPYVDIKLPQRVHDWKHLEIDQIRVQNHMATAVLMYSAKTRKRSLLDMLEEDVARQMIQRRDPIECKTISVSLPYMLPICVSVKRPDMSLGDFLLYNQIAECIAVWHNDETYLVPNKENPKRVMCSHAGDKPILFWVVDLAAMYEEWQKTPSVWCCGVTNEIILMPFIRKYARREPYPKNACITMLFDATYLKDNISGECNCGSSDCSTWIEAAFKIRDGLSRM
jgi:hypothetical protein